MLIQLPVMYALSSNWRTPQLQNGRFCGWIWDVEPYYLMPILAAVFTFMSIT